MSQEKASELFQWKNSLDDLKNLPGEPEMNKLEAWQNLHARLDKKRCSNRIAWYWIAAASFIVGISIFWLFADSGKPEAVVTHTKASDSFPTRMKKDSVPEQQPVQSPVVAFQKQRLEKRESGKQTYRSTRSENPVTPVFVSNFSRDTVHEITVAPPNSVDTLVQTVAAPIKKKLSVVHINELEATSDQLTQYARGLAPASRGTRSKTDRLSTVLLTRNSSDDIVKIKLSPSN